MDLGKWQQYSAAEKRGFLSSIRAAAETHLMPPGRYLLMHREARLSSAELRALTDWTARERERLRSAP